MSCVTGFGRFSPFLCRIRIESYMNFERLSGLFFVFELPCRFCRICRIFSAVSVFVCSDVVFGFCIF